MGQDCLALAAAASGEQPARQAQITEPLEGWARLVLLARLFKAAALGAAAAVLSLPQAVQPRLALEAAGEAVEKTLSLRILMAQQAAHPETSQAAQAARLAVHLMA